MCHNSFITGTNKRIARWSYRGEVIKPIEKSRSKGKDIKFNWQYLFYKVISSNISNRSNKIRDKLKLNRRMNKNRRKKSHGEVNSLILNSIGNKEF